MGLEPGSQNRKPVPGKALLPTDDFLGHGEQGQQGQGDRILSAPSCPGSPAVDSKTALGPQPWEMGAPPFEASQLGYRPAGWPHRRKCRDQG